jgi:hypothetical protein
MAVGQLIGPPATASAGGAHTLKARDRFDDLVEVPAANGPQVTGTPVGASAPPDLSAESWWAVERKNAGTATASGTVDAPAPPGPPTTVPAWQQRRRWLQWARLWAVLKMASLGYTTWWTLGYIHANVGAQVCGYGAVCLFAGVGAHWRRRFFGPGQLMEPELYEEIGQWLYRIGSILVLVGGALSVAHAAMH